MVRIEIKNPRPNIDFNEWDGLLRIVFVRKNKTIAAGFKSSNVIEILEKNYKTFLATQESNNNDSMMVDDKSISLKDVVKNKITTVLTETGFSDKRAGKLDQTDFLKLLYAFHHVGIHFA